MFEDADLLELHRRMLVIRGFEQRVAALYRDGEVPGFVHLSIGQEAAAVGACWPLRAHDVITSTHRGHGHCLAKGLDPLGMFAELMGKDAGTNRGRGGSMHIADPTIGIFGANGIVAAGLPIAAGAATAAQLRRDGSVAVAFFGDGAVAHGTFHEAVNLAALWRLPVVFLVTNNQFGMGTALGRHSAVTDLQRKGESLGVPGMRCDGMDVLDTYAVLCEAIARVRDERRPLLVEAVTYRFRGHSMADPEQYRSKEEVAQWRERDPIPAFAERLIAAGVIDDDERERIDAEAIAQVDAAVEFADASPFPPATSLYDDVYVLGGESSGWYSVRTTDPRRDAAESTETTSFSQARDGDEIQQQMTEALVHGEDSA